MLSSSEERLKTTVEPSGTHLGLREKVCVLDEETGGATTEGARGLMIHCTLLTRPVPDKDTGTVTGRTPRTRIAGLGLDKSIREKNSVKKIRLTLRESKTAWISS